MHPIRVVVLTLAHDQRAEDAMGRMIRCPICEKSHEERNFKEAEILFQVETTPATGRCTAA